LKYYLGIDIGTFESKGVIVNQQGDIVVQSARAHKMLVPQVGWAEHRANEDWWSDCVFLCQELIQSSAISAADIASIACSGIGPCMLPVDSTGEPLMNAVLYGVDARAAEQIESLNNDIGETEILDKCGNALTSQSVGPKILWLKEQRPDIFRKTHKIVTCPTYLVHKLTGEYVIDHYTAANFSPLYDVTTQSWTTQLCPDLIKQDQLPRLGWSTEIAGHVTSEAAELTGLVVGTPVTIGTIDAAAEAVSVGTTEYGDMMIMYGSTMFMIQLTRERVADPRLWYAPWLFPSQHASMAGASTSGTLTHWFRDELAKELGDDAFIHLAQEAEASSPGANGLVFLPYFSGERTPIHDTSARGSWFGLTLTHTRSDMYRALLEGIAMGTRHITETFAELGHAPERLLAVGGGTKNEIWSQSTSNFCKQTQFVADKTVGASYGNAFLAAIAVGDAELSDIKKWNPISRTIEPDANNACDEHYAVFTELYRLTSGLMKKLSRV